MRIVIDAEADLWVVCIGEVKGERFASIFRNTFLRLPEDVRSSLLRHWQDPSPAIGIDGNTKPLIRLQRPWAGIHGERHASCSDDGNTLVFWGPSMDRMPDAYVATIIAHELGHAYRNIMELALDDRATEEVQVVCLVEQGWGFAHQDAYRWLDENRPELRVVFARCSVCDSRPVRKPIAPVMIDGVWHRTCEECSARGTAQIEFL